MTYPAVDPARRFWIKAEPRGECWVWTANLDDKGYGRFFPTHDAHVLAHRYAYQLVNGPIASDVVIRHTCDNPPCINPEHLRAGTQLDNVRDRVDRGRGATGSRHPRWRELSATEIAAIHRRRAEGATIHGLGREFRTRHQTVSRVLRGSG